MEDEEVIEQQEPKAEGIVLGSEIELNETGSIFHKFSQEMKERLEELNSIGKGEVCVIHDEGKGIHVQMASRVIDANSLGNSCVSLFAWIQNQRELEVGKKAPIGVG